MAFLGAAGDTATTVLELAGLDSYIGGQQRIARAWVDATNAQDRYSASAARMSNTGTVLITAGAGIATSALVMGHSFLKAAGDMQQTKTGFATMLGSMDAAKAKIGELQKFAATTPFDFAQSAKGWAAWTRHAQRLLAMGVEADKLIPTMRGVASAVAAAGGNTEDFLGVLTALGQIKTKGTVSQEEINQMTERGIPALRILQRELGLTQDQIRDLGSQKIDADKAIGALLRGFEKDFGSALTDSAGNYNNAASNFNDALTQFKTVAGESLLPMATDALQSMTEFIGKANEFLQLHPDFAKYAVTFAAITGAVMVVGGAILKLRANFMMAAAAAKILNAEAGSISVGGSGGGRGRSGQGAGDDDAGEVIVGSDAAQASAQIRKIHDARKRASLELSRGMRELDGLQQTKGSADEIRAARKDVRELKKAGASQDEIDKAKARLKDLRETKGSAQEIADARGRVDRATSVREKLNEREKQTRDDFADTEEGKGLGGAAGGAGAALGSAQEIAEALASGEDAADVLKGKLEEIGQAKLDEFIEDPKQALADWKDQLKNFKGTAVKTFGDIKTFWKGGLSIPTANAGGLAGRVGALAGRFGLAPGALNQLSAFGRGGGALTGGGAVMGAALGIGAAVGARDDLKALGASEGAASLYAGILGAVTTGVTAFFPPARLIVGAAELFRLGVDKFYNEPLEKAATEGSLGTEGEKRLAEAKTKQEKADIYFDLAEKARGEGDDVSAQSFMLTANSLQRQGKRDAKTKAEADTKARLDAEAKTAREKNMLENPEKYTGVDPNASPLIRSARGIDPNGAFDTGEDPAPFSMSKRLLEAQGRPPAGLDFATNYGEGTNPNDYRERSRQSAAVIDNGAGYTVEENRNGTRRVVLDIPRDPNADLNERLRRHNQLKTRF